MKILEIGCGDGTLWTNNLTRLPEDVAITLSDISTGMIGDARRMIGSEDTRFQFQSFDCHQLPFREETFDLVIANHVLFYCDDISKVCAEVSRVLKGGGHFICSAYGENHMQEIGQLVQKFDERITLSADNLPKRFGYENGVNILRDYFEEIYWNAYVDELVVTEPEPLISYVLSCHGNQNQYLLSRYKDFATHVKMRTKRGFRITKDAGAFICQKKL